jgi:thioesterase domain-containing protein
LRKLEIERGEAPLCLLGYSFGAYLAYDTARMLELRLNRKTAHLMLLGAPSRQVQQQAALFQSDYDIHDEREFERRRAAHDSGFGILPKQFRDVASNADLHRKLAPIFIEGQFCQFDDAYFVGEN